MNGARTHVIVGASIAGVTAAETIREHSDDPVVLIDPDPHAPSDKTALSKAALFDPSMPIIALREAAHGSPADVASLVAFLASPLAGYINGSNILIDGGMSGIVR
jgi:NAD(P)-dependent dehydrogenase (short-subunit alcohol dehydrogenase family)